MTASIGKLLNLLLSGIDPGFKAHEAFSINQDESRFLTVYRVLFDRRQISIGLCIHD